MNDYKDQNRERLNVGSKVPTCGNLTEGPYLLTGLEKLLIAVR
jgi:hypothetical protein